MLIELELFEVRANYYRFPGSVIPLTSIRSSFDYWEILPGQGIYYNPPMNRLGEQVKTSGYVTDIITDLSRLRELRVISRSSAMRRW